MPRGEHLAAGLLTPSSALSALLCCWRLSSHARGSREAGQRGQTLRQSAENGILEAIDTAAPLLSTGTTISMVANQIATMGLAKSFPAKLLREAMSANSSASSAVQSGGGQQQQHTKVARRYGHKYNNNLVGITSKYSLL
uniref:Uncharacterized protein n=1 Tax=Globodera rostochiensis TaxID=31243 RepID=A0A914H3T6_GLORO